MVHEFVQKYKDRFGATPDGMAALAYDAARVLADSLKRAKSTKGSDIRDAIAATKNYSGVTGNITLGPDRNPIGKKIIIEEIKNGQLTLRKSIDPSAGTAAATDTSATTATTRTQ
jgi:branched-chain amino acid transport system substrate-binding protein